MKKSIYTIIIGSLVLFSACGEEKPADETTDNHSEETIQEDAVIEEVATEEIISEVEEAVPDNLDEIVSNYNYDQDWELIKAAILDKDIPGLGAWAASDEVDSEYLIMGASEEFVIQALKNTTYEDLKVEESGDEVYLVFYAEEIATDDEGNEYGSSFSIYLKQGDPNLLVAYYIAAG